MTDAMGAVLEHTEAPAVSTAWPIPSDDEILVATLGGVDRIGMNWTLYGHAGKWLLVDAGIGFSQPGSAVRAWMPDHGVFDTIWQHVEALVVTHGHEDHIGAIAHMWPDVLDCPIWATPFASGLISHKLREHGVLENVELRAFLPGDTLPIGPFSVETVAMTHSVPEPVSLAITTSVGTVFHSGDWKLDPEPLLGQPTDVERLKTIGDRGVLAAVVDSTNVGRDGAGSSERDVQEGFCRLMADVQGSVVVVCFASNVARVASAAIAADRSGRMVALAGRSMRLAEGVADALGMLDHVPEFLAEPRHLHGLERRRMALVCTGAQGEENAVLARLAAGGSSNLPDLEPGDVVVISARTIPGNEAPLESIIRRLRARHVTVLTGADRWDGHPMHVSGHAGAAEARVLYDLVRPARLIPVHGERSHLDTHAALADTMAIPHTSPLPGGIIRLRRGGDASLVATVPVPLAPVP